MTNPIDLTGPPLLPPAPAPAKPHPIDVALAALSEVATELLTSNRPSRFAELQQAMQVAQAVQLLRPAALAGVEDMGLLEEEDVGDNIGGPMIMRNPILRRRGRRMAMPAFNDGADLNTQIIMMAQSFLEKYTDIEKLKAKKTDSRMSEVMELESLMGLRMQLTKNEELVPDAIAVRIDYLLKRIGEPTHEPEQDPVVPAEPLRGHPPDGAGEPDGGRLGEPLAERAGGDDGAR